MSENPYDPAATPPPPPPPPPPGAAPAQAQYGMPMGMGPGSLGKIRSTGISILLFIVTFGIYGWFWYYGVHDEMKRHKGGDGLGGTVALILAIFVGFVMPFLTSSEVGGLYERRGQQPPVTGITGLWILLPLAGAIVWFVKTNAALNDYWASLGVTKQ